MSKSEPARAAARTPDPGPVGADPWQDPRPLLRGVAWWDPRADRPVRARPEDTGRLPWDMGERATLPIGVRLEFRLDAERPARAVELRYRAEVPPAGTPLWEFAHGFALWDRTGPLAEVFAPPAPEGVVRLELPARAPTGTLLLYPPEGRAPRHVAVRGIGGPLLPAPAGPRWVVHGDSITEGWSATRPAHGWAAVAGRALGWDTVNLGYAGGARGELAVAEQLAALPADVLTLAFGTNCWHAVPHTAPLLEATARTFLELVRQGHPRTPLLMVSPVLRPEAERTPNRVGATLGALREAMERAVLARIAAGDDRLALLPGRGLLGVGHLPDGLHPDDAGHLRLGGAVVGALRRAGFAPDPAPDPVPVSRPADRDGRVTH
ncbi:GDSL-type esterase/lipase family protein [Streptomyces sp. BI20]|uniref:GDSL-type esterase/lipase family protein n=1 Tax=Streptomyces sp. BI20 TaxID=3403460 RepID=UPI003C734E74